MFMYAWKHIKYKFHYLCARNYMWRKFVNLWTRLGLDNFIDHVRAWGFCGRGLSAPQENQLSRRFLWIKQTLTKYLLLTEVQPLENTWTRVDLKKPLVPLSLQWTLRWTHRPYLFICFQFSCNIVRNSINSSKLL